MPFADIIADAPKEIVLCILSSRRIEKTLEAATKCLTKVIICVNLAKQSNVGIGVTRGTELSQYTRKVVDGVSRCVIENLSMELANNWPEIVVLRIG